MTKHTPTPSRCPFCDKAPQFGLKKKTGCQMHGDPIQHVTLSCINPYCPVRPSCTGGCRYRGGDEPKYEREARDMAVEIWNKRPVTDALVEALKTVRSGLQIGAITAKALFNHDTAEIYTLEEKIDAALALAEGE